MARLLEIFRSGRHVASDGSPVNFSQRDLEEVASTYDPALHEAPIVVGHPGDNAPAFGWIKALGTRASSLEALPAQVDPAFAEHVRAGRYKKVSASFYRPESPNNPTPGKWYLRHVGFLGAQPPSVKGLRTVDLADGDQAVEVEVPAEAEATEDAPTVGGALTALRAWIEATLGAEIAEKALPEAALAETDDPKNAMLALRDWITTQYAPATPAPGETPAPDGAPAPADLAERRRAIARSPRELELAKREAALAKRETDLRRHEHVAFLEGLVREGRPLPAPREDLIGLLELADAAPVSALACFAEGEVRTPGEVTRDILRRLPRQVDFSERTRMAGESSDDPAAVARAAQEHQAAQAAKGIHVSTSAAVRAVKGAR